MPADPELLLALLAVRMLGGQAIDPKAALLKIYKKPLQEAVEKKLLEHGTAQKTTTAKTGKTSSKEVAVIGLTPEGEALLQQAADPTALATTGAGYLKALKENLDADRQHLRAKLEAALKPMGKGSDGAKIHKELEGVKKKVEDLTKQLGKLEKASQGGNAPGTTDQANAEMLARLEEKIKALLEAALKSKGKGPDENKIHQGLEAVKKKVEDLATQLDKLEKASQGSDDSPVLAKIDQAYVGMMARVEEKLKGMPATGQEGHGRTSEQNSANTTHAETTTQAPTHPVPQATTPDPLPIILHAAYEKLRRFIDYQDGLVPLHKLYHEASLKMSNLTVAKFHEELMDLWGHRELELHVLNEEDQVFEPDKGIKHHDKFYYYVMWKRQ